MSDLSPRVACAGRKIVAVFGESVSVSVSASWNASIIAPSAAAAVTADTWWELVGLAMPSSTARLYRKSSLTNLSEPASGQNPGLFPGLNGTVQINYELVPAVGVLA